MSTNILFICNNYKVLRPYYDIYLELYNNYRIYSISDIPLMIGNDSVIELDNIGIDSDSINEIIKTYDIRVIVFFLFGYFTDLSGIIPCTKICHYISPDDQITDNIIYNLRCFDKIIVGNPSLDQLLRPYLNNITTVPFPIVDNTMTDNINKNKNNLIADVFSSIPSNKYRIYCDISLDDIWYQLEVLFKIITKIVTHDTNYIFLVNIESVDNDSKYKINRLVNYYQVSTYINIFSDTRQYHSILYQCQVYLQLYNYSDILGNRLLLSQYYGIPVVSSKTHITKDFIINGEVVMNLGYRYQPSDNIFLPLHDVDALTNNIIKIQTRCYSDTVMANTISRCYTMCMLEPDNTKLSYTPILNEIKTDLSTRNFVVLDFKTKDITRKFSNYNRDKCILLHIKYRLIIDTLSIYDYFNLLLECLINNSYIIQLQEYDYLLSYTNLINIVKSFTIDGSIVININDDTLIKNCYIIKSNNVLCDYCRTMMERYSLVPDTLDTLDTSDTKDINISEQLIDNIKYNLDPVALKVVIELDNYLISRASIIIDLRKWANYIDIWENLIKSTCIFNNPDLFKNTNFSVKNNDISLGSYYTGTINNIKCQWNMIGNILDIFYLDNDMNLVAYHIDITDNILVNNHNTKLINNSKVDICIVYITSQLVNNLSLSMIRRYAQYHGYHLEIIVQTRLLEVLLSLEKKYQWSLVLDDTYFLTNLYQDLSIYHEIYKSSSDKIILISRGNRILDNIYIINLNNISVEKLKPLISKNFYIDNTVSDVFKVIGLNEMNIRYLPSINIAPDECWNKNCLITITDTHDLQNIIKIISQIKYY